MQRVEDYGLLGVRRSAPPPALIVDRALDGIKLDYIKERTKAKPPTPGTSKRQARRPMPRLGDWERRDCPAPARHVVREDGC